ncbi:thiopeptide-type bacteriocin biosynthesis protein [Streptomyces sp. NBC_00249]|uniref:thiopeptide-type bacteriocin biosynthesis protein n=1 Tax=Streptomyces sp. NBC_00249 TaxID=2975690 RepID=UPI00224C9C44|nr:thiopeptide-type bacteriocin biosynthesis protein [Streptomyces sp. NBC_00249]MCX5197392.1 thiopeptide-type bacteriocin biosynthesis protein [Streptomyces sp. NBC_00249]
MTTTDAWHSHHLFLHSTTEDTDAFLRDEAAPLLDGLVASGDATRWFFIRYAEDGPHVRIRVRGLSPRAAAELPDQLARSAKEVPSVPGPWPSYHGEVRAVPYEPETDRYGGPAALPVAEEVFAASSRAALDALRELPARGAASARLTLAADLAHATAEALGMDRLTAARWLRGHAAGWRWVTEIPLLPGASVHTRVNTVYAAQRTGLAGRAAGLRERLAAGTAVPWLGRWADGVREADAVLRAARGDDAAQDTAQDTAQDSAQDATAWIWASQLHMLFNRLGVSPDEERAVCRLAARTLLETDEPPAFFPPGHTAPDLQYLERSKFQIGRNEDTALRPLPPRPATVRPELDLPAGPLPDVSLRTVLAGRSSLRGALTGPLDADALGALLWHALSGSDTPGSRPYPSAGALYTVRVRLLVLDVAGVPAGTYEAVPERRTLRRIGPAAPAAQIKPLSTYLSRPDTDPDWIGVDGSPAVLGVYADLGLLRRRYGLRALRLALLEAGHLTQNLLLTAGALGLAGTPLGGFHDDLAHELLALDDLEQPLQYLLPLGRRPERAQGRARRGDGTSASRAS